MELIIALILVIIMIMIDYYQPEKFTNYSKCLNPYNLNNIKTKIISKENTKVVSPCGPSKNVCEHFIGKINVWIFNNFEKSSVNWLNFGSRNTTEPISDIVNLCNESVQKNLDSNKYSIKIINQDNLDTLIPEYKSIIGLSNNKYMKYNIIKYAILNKFGGIWIPKDTLILRNIPYDNSIINGKVITYSRNNNNIIDNKGFSDEIISMSPKNIISEKMLSYIKANVHTFQNGIQFKNAINKYFNILLSNCSNHKFVDLTANTTCSGKFVSNHMLFSTNFINLYRLSHKSFFPININHIKQFHKYNYIIRMNKEQLIKSNLFLAYLLKYSLH